MKTLAKLALMVFAFISINITNLVASNEYVVDDAAIENAISSVDDNLFTTDFNTYNNSLIPNESCEKMGSKNAWIAFGLAAAVYIIPRIINLPFIVAGMHRIYLGTKTWTWVGYILTCGGCGIVQLVDTVLLLIGAIKGDVSKYEDNPKFFMW
ncbi:MAG: TM2 domain-containing protein [Bacteroidia bacterium]